LQECHPAVGSGDFAGAELGSVASARLGRL
jgi:hypothetical protein